jgi:hypothetical protein
MNCTRCGGLGFLNIEQVPSPIVEQGTEATQAWMETSEGKASDVAVCDCCGDGEGWYGEPGQHYTADDPRGKCGPYAYNGGLAECH